MRKPLSASRSVAQGEGPIGRLANGLLRLFDDEDQRPDYEARRDRMRGPLLRPGPTGAGGQSSSSASQ